MALLRVGLWQSPSFRKEGPAQAAPASLCQRLEQRLEQGQRLEQALKESPAAEFFKKYPRGDLNSHGVAPTGF